MLKLKMMLLRDDVAAGRRRFNISSSSASAWGRARRLSGVDNAASPRLADTAERDYFTLRERPITMQTTEANCTY